ncbi:hypothetical protein OESDEN_08732 [Oesophagostomum dentatum]|uniref:Uncharacterized protein n=1 Tax=Oesophagostomum dentatum TaxID=61180 RepID=A0A0B1T7N4_OESDE|nr:hypothetical protein OESDEN_08732 [Oesophagostomum dentatum]
MDVFRLLSFLSFTLAASYAQLLMSANEKLCLDDCYFFLKGNNTKIVEGKTVFDFNAMIKQCTDDPAAPANRCERLRRVAKNERLKKFIRVIESVYPAKKGMCTACIKQ